MCISNYLIKKRFHHQFNFMGLVYIKKKIIQCLVQICKSFLFNLVYIIGLMSIESLHINYQKADKNYFCSTKIGRNMLYIIYTPVYKYTGTCIHTLTFILQSNVPLQEYQKVIDMISLICFIRIFFIITSWI